MSMDATIIVCLQSRFPFKNGLSDKIYYNLLIKKDT